MQRYLAVAALILGCQQESATFAAAQQPVTNGTVTAGDPAVVAITAADGTLRCTGTVISKRVVLTAAHCGVHLDPAGFRVFFGPKLGVGRVVALVEAVGHPAFSGTAAHDLALLLLAEDAPAPPVALSTSPPPASLRLVGFGGVDATRMTDGSKREGVAKTTEVNEQFVSVAADPSLPCSGDSGGPAFDESTLAAVVSRGDETCSAYGKLTRIDANLKGFIEPYLAATAARSIADGNRCLYDDHCVNGLCRAAVDDARLRFCTRACAADGECAAPMRCSERECRHPTPSPGAMGSVCSAAAACVDGECYESRCTRRCVTGRGDCAAGYMCALASGIDFFCKQAKPPKEPESDGGCAMSPRPASASPLFVLAALVLIRGGIRRRGGAQRARCRCGSSRAHAPRCARTSA